MGDSDWFWSFVDVRRSFRGVVDPVLGWRMASDAGRGPLNVVGGHRVSCQPSEPTVTVWWFGGLTTFGLVQRDGHTIPSEVARLAERDGIRIRSVGRTDPDDVYFQAVSEDERAARGTSRRTAVLSPDERATLTVEFGAAQYRRPAASSRRSSPSPNGADPAAVSHGTVGGRKGGMTVGRAAGARWVRQG